MMKKTDLRIIGLILLTGLLIAGCVTIGKENTGVFEHIAVPAHDFTSAGLVFSETVIEETFGSASGEVFTYNALLKEAQKLGADAIVNVTIDKKIEGTSFPKGVFFFKKKETWYGSALAIKYTTAVKEVITITQEGVTTTKEGTIMSRDYANVGAQTSNPAQPKKKLFGFIPLPSFLSK
jgi:hypothetical protein